VDEHIEVIKSEVKKQVKAELARGGLVLKPKKPKKPKKALAPGQTQLNDHSYLLKGMYRNGMLIKPPFASELAALCEAGEDVTIDVRAEIAESVAAAGKLPDRSDVRLPVVDREN